MTVGGWMDGWVGGCLIGWVVFWMEGELLKVVSSVSFLLLFKK